MRMLLVFFRPIHAGDCFVLVRFWFIAGLKGLTAGLSLVLIRTFFI